MDWPFLIYQIFKLTFNLVFRTSLKSRMWVRPLAVSERTRTLILRTTLFLVSHLRPRSDLGPRAAEWTDSSPDKLHLRPRLATPTRATSKRAFSALFCVFASKLKFDERKNQSVKLKSKSWDAATPTPKKS